MSNLAQRLITGSIFVVVLVGCIWFSPWTLLLLLLTITVLGLDEFYKLAQKANADPLRIYGVLTGAIIIIAGFLSRGGFRSALMISIPLLFLIFFIELFRKKSNPMVNIAWTLLGLIYIAAPLLLLTLTFMPEGLAASLIDSELEPGLYHYEPILLIFILIWVSDSMAYVCGRLFGKHKLWERISPKKTWEGFIGGMVFATATGALTAHWLYDDFNSLEGEVTWGLIGFVISWTGMLGDLVESMFKRSIDVKDSGNILPGHGGILDRFDALFLAVPFAVTALWLCKTIF